MFVRATAIVVLVVGACHDDEPLEKLVPVEPLRTFEAPHSLQPPPPPPPPPPPQAMPPPPAIAALVRDRFGAPSVTLYTFAPDGKGRGEFLGRAIRRSVPLAPAQAAKLIARLAADDAFMDGVYGCTCGGVGVRIEYGDDHVDFVVDCGNVYLADDEQAGSLAGDIVEYIDALL